MDTLDFLGISVPDDIAKYRRVFARIAEKSANGLGVALSPEEAQDACRYVVAMERMLVDAYVLNQPPHKGEKK